MNKLGWMALLVAALAVVMVPGQADAKRIGGGKSTGMQRSSTPNQTSQSTPATPAAAPQTPAAPAAAAAPTAGAATAAAAPKRSWMGPLAGLAAGLGLAALFSHFGMGEGLANFVMIALLALAAFVVIRLLMRRFAGGATAPMAMAGASAGGQVANMPPARFVDERPGMQRDALSPQIGSDLKPPLAVAVASTATVAAPAGPALPAGFDAEAFERLAKMIFIRMQAANDAADLNDLRNFTTPELFASLRLDLQERGAATQHTDVEKVEAQVLDFAEEAESQIVSVRFQGLVREAEGAEATPFDEVWHLVKPRDDSRNWAIAGIQQTA